MTVSVVIPVYGAAPYLQRCVAALRAQTLPPSQIIVFHSGPEDPTGELGRAFPDISVYHSEDRHFAGAARNAGAVHAAGDMAVFIDSDVMVVPGFIEAMQAAATDHPGAVLIGSLGCYPVGGLWAQVAWFIESGSVFPNRPAHQPKSAPAPCFAMPRSVFEAAGGFRTDVYAAEDGDFFVRLRAAGHALQFVPAARGDHVFAGGMGRTLKRLGELGQAAAFLRRTHDLPGSAAVRQPLLAFLLPFARMAQMLKRLMTEGGPVGQFLLLSPAILLGLMAWAWGFYREARTPTYPSATARDG
ncbi:MAG: glycosyltransferase family 2 protein [Pseudomonadota bacterium]